MAVQTPSDHSRRSPLALPSAPFTSRSRRSSARASFYERLIGLEPHELDDGSISFGAAGGPPLLQLIG